MSAKIIGELRSWVQIVNAPNNRYYLTYTDAIEILAAIEQAEARGREAGSYAERSDWLRRGADSYWQQGRDAGLEEAAKVAAECLDVGKTCKHVTATFIEEHKAYDFGWCKAASEIEREIRTLKRGGRE